MLLFRADLWVDLGDCDCLEQIFGGCSFLEHIYGWVWLFGAFLWVGVAGCTLVGKLLKLTEYFAHPYQQ